MEETKEKKEPKYVELHATLNLTPEAMFGCSGRNNDDDESAPKHDKAQPIYTTTSVNKNLLNLLHPVRDTKFDNYEEK